LGLPREKAASARVWSVGLCSGSWPLLGACGHGIRLWSKEGSARSSHSKIILKESLIFTRRSILASSSFKIIIEIIWLTKCALVGVFLFLALFRRFVVANSWRKPMTCLPLESRERLSEETTNCGGSLSHQGRASIDAVRRLLDLLLTAKESTALT